jgi:hypothetical protein
MNRVIQPKSKSKVKVTLVQAEIFNANIGRAAWEASQIFLSYDTDHRENEASNDFLFLRVFFAAGTCLSSPFLAIIGGTHVQTARRSHKLNLILKNGLRVAVPCSIPGSAKFSLPRCVETDSGAHPASPIGTGDIFPGLKWQEREDDHSRASCIEVKNRGVIPSTPMKHAVA